MMIALAVPYADKDAAKRLGARWDSGRKVWYVPPGQLLTPFERWIPGAKTANKMLKNPAEKRRKKA